MSAHEKSTRIATEGVTGHPVAFPELAAFDKARRQLAYRVRDGVMHGAWEEGIKLFNTVHAKLARTPCRPCWLIHEILNSQGGTRIIEALEGRLSSVDSGVRDAFGELIERLESLSRVETSPLLGPFKNTRITDGFTLFVLRDLRLLEEMRNCLSGVMTCSEWEIVKPSSLRTQQHADHLFVFGPAWYLRHRNEVYLLQAPAAGDVHLVACAHEFAGEIRLSLLGDSENIRITGKKRAHPNESPWEFEPIAPAQRGRFRFKSSGESRIWESGKKMTAIPFRLGGTRGAYFGKDSSVWVVTADCSGPSPSCSGVEKIPVDELEPGCLVLMTTSGGGDMIPGVADMIIRRAGPIRELQRQWKSALLKHVEQDGLDSVSSLLKALGAQKASPTNLKNWCNPRSIGMENLGTDLRAVLKLIGMEARYDAVVSGIEELRSAHQSAGVQLQNWLRKSLHGKDLSEVFRRGQMEVRHGNGPAKTLFLVEERGEEDEIPEEWEGELREIDD